MGPNLRIIMGLGNPGARYEGTRHNVGFEALDRIARAYGISIRHSSARSLIGVGNIEGKEAILAKPQTYMNQSGNAAHSLLRQYQQDPSCLIVIQDDLDLEFGRIRVKRRGGHGGHRGVESLIEVLETDVFLRVKLGIARPIGETTEYVLEPFSPSEAQGLDEVLDQLVDVVRLIMLDQVDRAMNQYHT